MGSKILHTHKGGADFAPPRDLIHCSVHNHQFGTVEEFDMLFSKNAKMSMQLSHVAKL